jgi:hypothetical protein
VDSDPNRVTLGGSQSSRWKAGLCSPLSTYTGQACPVTLVRVLRVFCRQGETHEVRVTRYHSSQSGLLAATLALHLACASDEALPTPRGDLSANDLDEARAALLIRLHEEAVRVAPDARGSTCIDTDGGAAPSAHLLLLLSDRGLGIRNAARCVPRGGRLVDAISGAHAVALAVRSVRLVEPGKATAFGTYVLGGLWCGGGAYSIEFTLGQWDVVPEGSRIVC